MNAELEKIQSTLKSLMKQRKITHEGLGRRLRVSPATVKRRLNGSDLSLGQVKEISECLSISFYELIELSKKNSSEPHLFTLEQETFLASNLSNMNLFRMILGGQIYDEIKTALKMNDRELRASARAIEKVGLAKLLPGDRFIPIVRFPVRWNPEGPLSKTYNKLTINNVIRRIESDHGQAGLNRRFEIALTPELYEAFCREVDTIYGKYRSISELYLSSRIEWKNLVSGLFFIGRFSLWEGSKRN